MEKQTICIGKNTGTDQLRSKCKADQCLCFRYTDSTFPLLSKSKTVQARLCRAWSKPKSFIFSRTGSYGNTIIIQCPLYCKPVYFHEYYFNFLFSTVFVWQSIFRVVEYYPKEECTTSHLKYCQGNSFLLICLCCKNNFNKSLMKIKWFTAHVSFSFLFPS